MGVAGGFDEAVSHERAGGDDGFHHAGVDEIAKDEAHFADGERAGESHGHETIFIASHFFENVSRVANLAAGESGVAHGADEFVDGAAFGKIERKNRAEFVFHRVVKNAARDGFFAGLLGHRCSSAWRRARFQKIYVREKIV